MLGYYGQIANPTDVDTANPHSGSLVGRLLDEVNRRECAVGRPMLSAVVIGKETTMPDSGGFLCARDLRKYSGRDALAFWLEELRRVHDYWSRRKVP